MRSNSKPPRLKPPALRPGDTVGIVAPASDIKRELLDAGCNTLRRLGYLPFFLDSILSKDRYFAGAVERRAHELQEMFLRDEVRAIVCARGGYGANYLLRNLDLQTIASHPKIFVGYSDITTLLTWFTDAAGLVTFHGPMVANDFAKSDGFELHSWECALSVSAEWTIDMGSDSGLKALVEGTAEGVLYGGCLSMLAASLGTPYEIRTEGTVLFIEDVGAKPYQIDRMLMQLKLAGKLDAVRGIIFGEMLDCRQTANQGYTLEEIILRIVGDLGIPVAFGLRSGHVTRSNITLPIGVQAALRVDRMQVSLKILESSTTPAAASITEKQKALAREISSRQET
jgi:muramoyltetrapeptide carboxypeptidase